MPKTSQSSKKANSDNRRLASAKRNLQKMLRKIAPFTRSRRFTQESSAGEWRQTSSLYS